MTITTRGGGAITVDVPDHEDFRSYLLDLRPFTLSREDVHFASIGNILERTLTDDTLKERARANRRAWREAFEGTGDFIIRSRCYRTEDFFDLIVNGRLFHRDLEKKREFDSLPTVAKTWAEFALSELAVECAVVLREQADVIRCAKAQGALTFPP